MELPAGPLPRTRPDVHRTPESVRRSTLHEPICKFLVFEPRYYYYYYYYY